MQVQQLNATHKVTIKESDRFSGQKTLEVKYFTTQDEADSCAREVNKKLGKGETPEYYVYAEVDRL